MKPRLWVFLCSLSILGSLAEPAARFDRARPSSTREVASGFKSKLRPPKLGSLKVNQARIRDLDSELEPIRARHGVPALAAAVVRFNSLAGAGAVGVRKYGITEPVTVADRFHIGSCTKPMTATLAAFLVERGRIEWDTTIGEVFTNLTESVHPEFSPVTIEDLLSHRGGVPGDLHADGLWERLWRHPGTPREQRLFLIEAVTRGKPVVKPGTQYLYSNAGYAIAGGMIERIEGRSWEELLREYLFAPLGMQSAGFGVPATPRYVDEPWGHVWRDGVPIPIAPGTDADNPPSIGPGGTVHCSVIDLARFAALHLRGAQGGRTGLAKASFTRLHTAAGAEATGYALGWGVERRDWAGGLALTHRGSNTQWFTVMWLAPKRDFAVVVAVNIGGDAGFAACDEAAARMIELFL
jgi:CubicO group peptidase (beta-lactamase class C family)